MISLTVSLKKEIMIEERDLIKQWNYSPLIICHNQSISLKRVNIILNP